MLSLLWLLLLHLACFSQGTDSKALGTVWKLQALTGARYTHMWAECMDSCSSTLLSKARLGKSNREEERVLNNL